MGLLLLQPLVLLELRLARGEHGFDLPLLLQLVALILVQPWLRLGHRALQDADLCAYAIGRVLHLLDDDPPAGPQLRLQHGL